jgi:hypothetical protein
MFMASHQLFCNFVHASVIEFAGLCRSLHAQHFAADDLQELSLGRGNLDTPA